MLKLYGYRNGRTLRALWALEEVGATYEYVEVDILHGKGREPWFLKINPAGKVPVLDDDGTIVTESAAVCMHLGGKYPQSRLLPAAGTIERTECYKWTSYILTELEAPLWTIAKHRFVLPKERRVAGVIETASWEFRNALTILATALENRSYLAGGSFSVADILAAHTLLWAKSMRPPFGIEKLDIYLHTAMKRDAFKRAHEVTKQVPADISKA